MRRRWKLRFPWTDIVGLANDTFYTYTNRVRNKVGKKENVNKLFGLIGLMSVYKPHDSLALLGKHWILNLRSTEAQIVLEKSAHVKIPTVFIGPRVQNTFTSATVGYLRSEHQLSGSSIQYRHIKTCHTTLPLSCVLLSPNKPN